MKKNLTNYQFHISFQLSWTRTSIGIRNKEGSGPGRGVGETGLIQRKVEAVCDKDCNGGVFKAP